MNKGKNSIVFLGTGTSSGVPVLGCSCEVCSSSDPRDSRLRTSALVRMGNGAEILIDCGTDFRQQALQHGIRSLDGVLVTHSHQDHIGGIDELRQLNFVMNKSIDIYGNGACLEEIRERFSYIFKNTVQVGGGKPDLNLIEVSERGRFEIAGHPVTPIPVLHGAIPILGYRIGNLSYITDASFIPPESMEILRGTRVLVINALRFQPHPTHLSLGEALEIIGRIQPEKACLIHLTHLFKHERDQGNLPGNVFFAYDGLTEDFD